MVALCAKLNENWLLYSDFTGIYTYIQYPCTYDIYFAMCLCSAFVLELDKNTADGRCEL